MGSELNLYYDLRLIQENIKAKSIDYANFLVNICEEIHEIRVYPIA